MIDLNAVPPSTTTKQQQEDITTPDKLSEEDQRAQLFTVTKHKTTKQPSPGDTTEKAKGDKQITNYGTSDYCYHRW